MLRDQRGFGNSGCMFVAAVIGALAALALPYFADLIRQSNDGACKGNLGAIRSALSVFYGDALGHNPYHPSSLLFGKRYLPEIPATKTRYHPDSAAIRVGSSVADIDDAACRPRPPSSRGKAGGRLGAAAGNHGDMT